MEKENEKLEEIVSEDSDKNKENKVLDKNIKKKQNMQIIWVILLMGILILASVASPIIYNNYFNKFEYAGLDFQKTKLGKIIFYSAKIPLVKSYTTSSVIREEDITGSYPINFRNDPRGLENIRVNISSEDMKFIKTNVVYISLDPEMKKCEDNALALMNFAGFLGGFGGMKIKSAISDKNASRELNITYAKCSTHPTNTVIQISSGNETTIYKKGENCYQLLYKDCEILQLTEKFQIAVLEGYMKYFQNSTS